MKKYELKKCSAEFAWKERKEIKEGCTMYDVEPERLGEFESFSKMEIEVVDNETLELICTAENYEEAEKIAEDYAEEAGAHLML